jgi:flagellar biogenesis protein FliO
MVDELELLKKEWQKQDETLPKLSKEDIYPMLLKKSSSIVKWIFIISMLEFLLWIVLSFAFGSDDSKQFEKEHGLQTFDTIILVLHLGALVFFVFWFYRNYKRIESTDSSKVLLENIIKTRKTVKYYIWFSMAFLAISSFIAFIISVKNDPGDFADRSMTVLSLQFMAVISVIMLLMWGFYKMIYGILMRRLDRNYKELKKIES